MSVLDIVRTDSESRTEIDQLRNPSETIWPATVAIIVELCPENKSAIANITPAAKRKCHQPSEVTHGEYVTHVYQCTGTTGHERRTDLQDPESWSGFFLLHNKTQRLPRSES